MTNKVVSVKPENNLDTSIWNLKSTLFQMSTPMKTITCILSEVYMNNKNQITYETHFVTISDFLSVTELNKLQQRRVYNTCDAKLNTNVHIM